MEKVGRATTGLPGLDGVIKGLYAGDNVVWRVKDIDEYMPFVRAFCEGASKAGSRLVYFRFGTHAELVPEGEGSVRHKLTPELGFETFIAQIFQAIREAGPGARYVFDCMSDLVYDWSSDRMLGNFFSLAAPRIAESGGTAYFVGLRGRHSYHANNPISYAAQIILDVYTHGGECYVRPLKAVGRRSRSIYMLHRWKTDDDFVTVSDSASTSEILRPIEWSRLDSATHHLGFWSLTFDRAERMFKKLGNDCMETPEGSELFDLLLRMMVTRDERKKELARKHLDMETILKVRHRMVGTGQIGGKASGMLFARGILKKAGDNWEEKLEAHDSFFIGSDVFYTFLVQNDCWWIKQLKDLPDNIDMLCRKAVKDIGRGRFPNYIVRQFADVIDYFGQAPFIVRSSSLLEDDFGNAFSGKYDSVFCVNQGSPEERLDAFVSAVRRVYASSVSREALDYRARRGLLDKDEQMAILIQRVSGSYYGTLYFPQAAGVAFSFNPYVWHKDIDPNAGLLRLVFGLGTRAVDRADDDYTRVVSLNAPERRPEATSDQVRAHAQRRVDVLDIENNEFTSRDFEDVARSAGDGLPIDIFADHDEGIEKYARERGLKDVFSRVLTFDKLLKETGFVKDMREMVAEIARAYDYPVDLEFTVNFAADGRCRTNFVQCRPLQVSGPTGKIKEPPERIDRADLVLETYGTVIGHSRETEIDRLIYIEPIVYGRLPIRDRHAIAGAIGRIAHSPEAVGKTVFLLGPGRWGTASPELGVPVSFAAINRAAVICEIVAMRDDLIPDVSLGTHFFNDLVENDILYLAHYPDRDGSVLAADLFQNNPNKLAEIAPDAARWSDTIKVIDVAGLPRGPAPDT